MPEAMTVSYFSSYNAPLYPEDKMLAGILHENMCDHHAQHHCNWCNEDDWESSEHQYFLEKARKALEITDYCTAIKLSNILK